MGILLEAKRRTTGRRATHVFSKPARSSRIPTWVIFLLLAILVAVILLPPLGRQIFVSQQRQLPDSAGPLVKFQQSLSHIDRQLDAANAKYRDSSSAALRSHNLLALFDATNAYEATLDGLYRQTMAVDQPRSDNGETNAWATRARKVRAQRVSSLRSANHLMVEAVDSGEISGAATEAMEKARASAEAKYQEESAALRRSYQALKPGDAASSATAR